MRYFSWPSRYSPSIILTTSFGFLEIYFCMDKKSQIFKTIQVSGYNLDAWGGIMYLQIRGKFAF